MTTFNIDKIKNKYGYTLMEVLVTVVLIGVLSTAAIPYYRDYVERQRATSAISTLRTIADSVDRYMALHNQTVPTKFTMLDMKMSSGSLNDDKNRYDDGFFTYTISSTEVKATRNTNFYTLGYTLTESKLTCTCTSDAKYCEDKLNID